MKTTPYVAPYGSSAWAQYTICVQNRDAFQESLKQAGIPTTVHYPIPLNKQPAVANPDVQLPVGNEVASRVVSLPMSPYIDKTSQDRVIAATIAFFSQ